MKLTIPMLKLILCPASVGRLQLKRLLLGELTAMLFTGQFLLSLVFDHFLS